MITPEGGLAKHKETPGLALLNGRAVLFGLVGAILGRLVADPGETGRVE
jgi:hypothetical protein